MTADVIPELCASDLGLVVLVHLALELGFILSRVALGPRIELGGVDFGSIFREGGRDALRSAVDAIFLRTTRHMTPWDRALEGGDDCTIFKGCIRMGSTAIVCTLEVICGSPYFTRCRQEGCEISTGY